MSTTIEAFMYVSIGFLSACLLALAVIPPIHGRAVRITMRRIEEALPVSIGEIHASKDLLRAEFALSIRRLECKVERLTEEKTSLQCQLGRKGDVITRLMAERNALKSAMSGVRVQIQA